MQRRNFIQFLSGFLCSLPFWGLFKKEEDALTLKEFETIVAQIMETRFWKAERGRLSRNAIETFVRSGYLDVPFDTGLRFEATNRWLYKKSKEKFGFGGLGIVDN